MIGKVVIVDLKNDLSVRGVLHSVDQFLNIKLTQIDILDPVKFPHLASLQNIFIRGSVVRYIHLSPDDVDTQLLQDATRRAHRGQAQLDAAASVSVAAGQ